MRTPPILTMICPPTHPWGDCILREGNVRQQWQAVALDAHQLDYYTLEELWPGWRVFGHEGRYLSEHTLGKLVYWTMERPNPGPLLLAH